MDQSECRGRGHLSVLSCFPPSVARDVVVAVVTPLGTSLANPETPSLLSTDRQVKWTMEVLSYGLTLPLDKDTVKLCVDIYSDWLMALVSPKDSIPPPISRDPNLYAQKILRHLYSIFLSRCDQMSPVYRQVLCAIQSLARESSLMTRDTWEALLHFLLRINHNILAPPTAAGGGADLSMEVLLEVWMLSCSRCFPSRSLWRTCRQMLSRWRHQPAVVDQWIRAVAPLTSRLLLLTFGPSFPPFKVPDDVRIPADLDDERVPETWFRFLHLFSNPVDVTLPDVFFRAMRGVGTLVDAFLGVNKQLREQQLPNTAQTSRMEFRDQVPSLGVAVTRSPFRDRPPCYGVSRPRSGSAPPTPVNISSPAPTPAHNRQPKAVSKATSKVSVTSWSPQTSWSSQVHHWTSSSLRPPSPSPLRSNVDSLLHLFGCWLFDAAQLRDSVGQKDVSVSESWASGRAEACGTLCRIFTSKKTAEDILSIYLSRFYLVLLQNVQVSKETCPPVLASILLTSTSLFCCDLRGVNLLLPPFVPALETVLLDRELLRFKGFVNPVDLRRASILILMSLLPLPLQFGSVHSQVSLDGKLSDVTAGNFLSLMPRLTHILIGALQTETDSSNTQLILAAMLNLVQDSALLEASRQTQCGGTSRPRTTAGSSGARGTRGTGANRWTKIAQLESVVGLWVQVERLLTRGLTSQWRNDSAVCLSALEVLGGLAKVEVLVEDSERRSVVSSVCTYIMFQCSRPPPLHSRDLHSIIVAAFYCLNVWLTQHPALLDHQECLLEVLEIVELGISGSKSRQEAEVKCKEDKELNPASLRVKEAAEATLSCIMQGQRTFPSVNEDVLIGCSSLSDKSLKTFKYFVIESSVILAMLEQAPRPEQAQSPSLTLMIRGLSGCHTWTLQLHLQPREQRTQQTLVPAQHCVAQRDPGKQCGVRHELCPENTVPSVEADQSIPYLQDSVPEEVQYLLTAFRRQQEIEAQPQVKGRSVIMTTCRPPSPVSIFQMTRLFLSHLGLLTPETVKDPGVSGVPPQLVSLDSSLPGFFENLRHLDRLSSRSCLSAYIFYMKAGQGTAAEILSNVESHSSVHPHFLDFLSSLGWPVKVGGVNVASSEFLAVLGDSGGGIFDGERFVLMFADALSEISFIVPSSSHVLKTTKRTTSNMADAEHITDSAHRPNTCPSGPELKQLIVWVERFEDVETFPLSDLLSQMRTQREMRASNIQVVFVHPLRTGLYRICFHGASSRFGFVVPLVHGSVVSRRTLGFLVRETLINCCQRRWLDIDSAPPPHTRKQLISDIILRYSRRCPEPAFYSSLFHDP
ncbi:ral GTPase-activating protein subunit beta [Mugil cephalus]|uniref:ral GTPase-activating protein subunit beta n=1 Tax=Mugil cephalus TaxID=48193 RepID=UPI001FB6FF52|nr:ral GTPase-activating protein subunit beta [Mugil cephalus]